MRIVPRVEAAVWSLLLAAAALPAVLVRIPPLLDYPNHFARLWLLAGGAASGPAAQMYAIDWSGARTNIAIDLMAAALGGLLPVTAIGALALVLAIVLPAIGVAALNARLFGGFSPWAVLTLVLVFGWTLLAGFLNFQIGLGLALIAAAADARLQRHGALIAFGARTVISGVILIVHPFALLFYAALLGGLALGPTLPDLRRRADWFALIRRGAPAAAAVVVPLVILVVTAPALPGGGGAAAHAVWPSPSLIGALSTLLTGFKTYSLQIDLVYALAFFAVIAVAALSGEIRVHRGLVLAALLLAAVSLFMPLQMLGTGAIEKRLPVMALLALAAAVRPGANAKGRARVLLLVAAAAIALSRIVYVGHAWLARQDDVAAVSRALAPVPPGARVLPVGHVAGTAEILTAPTGRYLGGNTPTFWHYPALAVTDRQAFIPNLFAAAGKQPIRVKPPFDQISVSEGPLPSIDVLTDRAKAAPFRYLADWKRRFDYVLVLNADTPHESGLRPLPPELELIADEGFATLYRIRKPGA